MVTVVGPKNVVRCRRSALRAMLSMVVAVVPGMAIAPAADAAVPQAALVVQHAWQDGFIARYVVANPTAVPMADWKIEFDLPAGESVSHAWNSSFTQYGTHYVITPANWNRVIPPGGTATGGFRGVLSGTYTPPSNCVLNGQVYCSQS